MNLRLKLFLTILILITLAISGCTITSKNSTQQSTKSKTLVIPKKDINVKISQFDVKSTSYYNHTRGNLHYTSFAHFHFDRELRSLGINVFGGIHETDINASDYDEIENSFGDIPETNFDFYIDLKIEETRNTSNSFNSHITIKSPTKNILFQNTYSLSLKHDRGFLEPPLLLLTQQFAKQIKQDTQAHLAMGLSVTKENKKIEKNEHATQISTAGPSTTQIFPRTNLSPISPKSTNINSNITHRKLALIIGNSKYKDSPLNNPINDANDLSKNLQKLNFKVHTVLDASKREIVEAINTFSEKLSGYDVGLFFYAGHGMQIKGRNYLIPIEAQINAASDVEFEAVDVGRLLAKMESYKDKINIVMLDACRNNPYSSAFRSSSRGLARVDAPAGSFIAYATAPGRVAADGTDRNGVFTKHLLRHINTPNITIESLLKRVRIGVMKETDDQQIPWQSSSMTGEFYFVKELDRVQ